MALMSLKSECRAARLPAMATVSRSGQSKIHGEAWGKDMQRGSRSIEAEVAGEGMQG